MQFLVGKKTYIAATAIVLAAAGAFLAGDITLADAIYRILEGLGLASLRAGVAKAGE